MALNRAPRGPRAAESWKGGAFPSTALAGGGVFLDFPSKNGFVLGLTLVFEFEARSSSGGATAIAPLRILTSTRLCLLVLEEDKVLSDGQGFGLSAAENVAVAIEPTQSNRSEIKLHPAFVNRFYADGFVSEYFADEGPLSLPFQAALL